MGKPDDMTDSGAGEVRITPSKVYETVMGMKDSMAKIESLLETHIAVEGQSRAAIETRLENHGTRLGTHDTRLTVIEGEMAAVRNERSQRTPWTGKVTAIVAIISGASIVVGLLITLSRVSDALSSL